MTVFRSFLDFLWPKYRTRAMQSFYDGFYGRESVRATYDGNGHAPPEHLDMEWQRGQMFRLSGVFLTDNRSEKVTYEPPRTVLMAAPKPLRSGEPRVPIEVVYKRRRAK